MPSQRHAITRTPPRARHLSSIVRSQEKNSSEGEESRDLYPTATIEKSEVFSNGITFSAFSEVAKEVQTLEKQVSRVTDPGLTKGPSFARALYTEEVESAFNDQINVELSISYVYAAMAAYFARDNVGLRGFAGYFASESQEERTHANMLLKHQVKRGGRVRLGAISSPESEFFHSEKGDVLFAAELALSLEKLNFQKLRALRRVAEGVQDDETTHYLDDYLLEKQAMDVEETAIFVSKLKRIGLGHGVWHMDKELMEKYPNAIDGILSGL
ncbi:MAG: hypothetical protein WDW36_003555 [Sanguina aurantia]